MNLIWSRVATSNRSPLLPSPVPEVLRRKIRIRPAFTFPERASSSCSFPARWSDIDPEVRSAEPIQGIACRRPVDKRIAGCPPPSNPFEFVIRIRITEID